MESSVKEKNAWDLFKNCEYGVVAVIDQDARPYSIPISPVVLDNNIYFHTSNKGKLK
ncbi:pyridoxamine 5'-phosphate oxidase family protein [endosymbiont 'TC1' of Trimyema compressum]|uniref:pyridoxamine 5'-phosphate oxidase family protein n=1 Tax=endosymbiont 'TC1' of Trimyema compressum TaxID=243899 RepID=UPI000B4DC1A1|nr:pyridoxamine 5'-phosphate oxidase family protein [endosymbiont 'TC1' of Trimyema compressum]